MCIVIVCNLLESKHLWDLAVHCDQDHVIFMWKKYTDIHELSSSEVLLAIMYIMPVVP